MSLIFITFMFKFNNTRYYGKYYTDNISPDHEGLDEVIKPYLIKGILLHYKQEDLLEINDKLHIGIISVSHEKYIAIHSSNEERCSFDFYCERFNINYKEYLKIYMFGKLLENSI